MADNTDVYIDYNHGSPVLKKSGNNIGKNDETLMYQNDTVTLQMRNFPSTCKIVDIKFFNNEDEADAHRIGTFTPTAAAPTATISSNNKNDFYCEIKQNAGVWDFTKAWIKDVDVVAANSEDDFWYKVDIQWNDSNGGSHTKTLDPELVNKPGSKGPGGG